MLNTSTRIALAFLLGGGIGAVSSYYITKKITESNCQLQIDEMHKHYEELYANLRASYDDIIQKEVDDYVETAGEESENESSGVPVDFLDRVTDATGTFIDYASISTQYDGETSETDIQEDGFSEPVEQKDDTPTPKESTKKTTKKKHRLPVRAITDEEYFDYCMKDEYQQKSYYLDDDCWANTNSSKADSISVDDFPIPVSEMKFDKKGVAYFVFEEKDTKILYKFWNRKDH